MLKFALFSEVPTEFSGNMRKWSGKSLKNAMKLACLVGNSTLVAMNSGVGLGNCWSFGLVGLAGWFWSLLGS